MYKSNHNSKNRANSTIKFIPLSHTIIKRLFFLFAILIIVTTSLTYNYLINKTELQFRGQLLEYINQRGDQESALFRLAKDNLIQLKTAFLFQYASAPQNDFADWFDSHMTQKKDGTFQSRRQYFEGIWSEKGTFEHGIDVVINTNEKITGELKKQIRTAYDVVLNYGPAWHTRFLNLWFVGPHKTSLIYWPEIQWDPKLSNDHSWKNETWFSKTNMINNPGRGLVWTGLYFDSVAGHWMISVAMPIDVEGKHIGTIGTDLECGDFFNRNLSDSMVSSYSIILGQDGHIIVHPYKIGEMISSRDPKFMVSSANDKQLKSIYEQVATVSKFPTIIDNVNNDELLAVTKIEGPEWYLISVYYKTLLKDQIAKNAYFMIALGLGSMIVALFLISSVVRKNISEPLTLLTKAAGNFDAGSETERNLTGFLNYLHRFQYHRNELGLLGQTLMKMGIRLKAVYRDLEKSKKNLETEILARTSDLVTAKEKAEASSRAKSDFLANMSHELRTPLNVILGFSRLMERDASISPEQVKNLELIHRSGDHLLALINDVLDMAKIESGQVAFTPECFDLLFFMDGIASMFQQRAVDKKLNFTFTEKSNVSRHIKTDKGKLRQVLFNLLGNAINYTNKGSILLQVAEIKASAPQTSLAIEQFLVRKPDLWIRFEIKDTGIGIEQKNIDLIFNQFIQAETRAEKIGGTGLGLTISRNFVQIMGSELKVKSKKGVGSIFWFDLPVWVADPTDLINVEDSCKLIGLAKDQPKFRILIVEDNKESRLLLTKLLQLLGFNVWATANGTEGVMAFLQFHPDLILMDIRMPKMDGLTATQKIKAMDSGRDTPVIAVTAHAFENEKLDILAAGCDDLIRKPFDEKELVDVLSKHIGAVFSYEERSYREKKRETSLEKTQASSIFTQLSEQLITELHSAVLELNFNRTIKCIESIREIDGNGADELFELANEFRFDQILERIESER